MYWSRNRWKPKIKKTSKLYVGKYACRKLCGRPTGKYLTSPFCTFQSISLTVVDSVSKATYFTPDFEIVRTPCCEYRHDRSSHFFPDISCRYIRGSLSLWEPRKNVHPRYFPNVYNEIVFRRFDDITYSSGVPDKFNYFWTPKGRFPFSEIIAFPSFSFRFSPRHFPCRFVFSRGTDLFILLAAPAYLPYARSTGKNSYGFLVRPRQVFGSTYMKIYTHTR